MQMTGFCLPLSLDDHASLNVVSLCRRDARKALNGHAAPGEAPGPVLTIQQGLHRYMMGRVGCWGCIMK